MKRRITNTAAEDPMTQLLRAMALGPSQAIEASETQGQRELVANGATLPVHGSEHPAWAQMGVTFGPPDPQDSIFRPATLPEGWKIEPTDHAMWSMLIDHKGRERAAIFYKAAFYDRSAHVSLRRRFGVRRDYETKDPIRAMAMDGKDIVFTTAPEKATGDFQKDYDTATKHEEQCQAWLTEHYPGWESPAAHWD